MPGKQSTTDDDGPNSDRYFGEESTIGSVEEMLKNLADN